MPKPTKSSKYSVHTPARRVQSAVDNSVTRDAHMRFTAWHAEHRGYVHALVRRAGVPAAEIEDAVQDVFCVLFSRIYELDRASSVRPWLWKVTTFVCQNRRRRAGRQARRTQQVAVHDVACDWPDPHSLGRPAKPEARLLLRAARSGFEERHWQVLYLTIVEGLSAREIAEVLQISPNTVSSRLRAARHRICRQRR
jgi:RNA polymerase sigma-70 factor (ECF subfamily)